MPLTTILLAVMPAQVPTPPPQHAAVFRAVKDSECLIEESGLRPIQLDSELNDLRTFLDGGEVAGLRRYVFELREGEAVQVALEAPKGSDLRLLFSHLRPQEGVASNQNRSAIMTLNRMNATRRNAGMEFRNHQKETFRFVVNVVGRLGFPYQLRIERGK